MTVGEIIDILEQFPRDQIMEMGIVTKITKEDPQWITCLPIADILVSEKHLIIVDPDSSDLVQEIIGSKLNVRRAGKSDKGGAEEKAAPPLPDDAAAAPLEAPGHTDAARTPPGGTPAPPSIPSDESDTLPPSPPDVTAAPLAALPV